MVDLSGATWRKSTRSGNGGNCVQFTDSLLHEQAIVGVRDSKDPTGPAMAFGPDAWQAFVSSIKRGAYDL